MSVALNELRMSVSHKHLHSLKLQGLEVVGSFRGVSIAISPIPMMYLRTQMKTIASKEYCSIL